MIHNLFPVSGATMNNLPTLIGTSATTAASACAASAQTNTMVPTRSLPTAADNAATAAGPNDSSYLQERTSSTPPLKITKEFF